MKTKNSKLVYSLLILCFSILFINACKKDKPVTILKVGDAYQGGKIAYLLQSGDPGYDTNIQHGLIAAETDQGTAAWDTGNSVETGAIEVEIGTGDNNTVLITLAVGSGNYAAKLCSSYFVDDYNDWHLPSINEMEKLYLNRVAIGGFASTSYWSSTETTMDNSMILNFSNGNKVESAKFGTFSVRAIRYF